RREPLIIEGCSGKEDYKVLGITVKTAYRSCHTWVIDGHLRQRITLAGTYTDTDYIHNNWGWNSRDNGYFKSGVFNSNLKPDLASGTKSGERYNYQYGLKIPPHIRR
ncbi:MAG: C10 family peptidase, partial [Fibromonadaceae bacterium]|nr:C10 family peptidase [Fibromonadaceae bacterium]